MCLQHEEHQLWSALERAHLRDYVLSMPDGIDTVISESETMFSVGQRQVGHMRCVRCPVVAAVYGSGPWDCECPVVAVFFVCRRGSAGLITLFHAGESCSCDALWGLCVCSQRLHNERV